MAEIKEVESEATSLEQELESTRQRHNRILRKVNSRLRIQLSTHKENADRAIKELCETETEAERALRELWETGHFNCDPQDYDFIVMSIKSKLPVHTVYINNTGADQA